MYICFRTYILCVIIRIVISHQNDTQNNCDNTSEKAQLKIQLKTNKYEIVSLKILYEYALKSVLILHFRSPYDKVPAYG